MNPPSKLRPHSEIQQQPNFAIRGPQVIQSLLFMCLVDGAGGVEFE
jgi:hypothetical protein